MLKIISFFLLVLFVQPAFANKVESVFSFTKNFDYKSCKMPVRNKTELPKVFVTVLGYSGAKELPSERVVSNYREYFMSLSSNARISEKYARLTRDEIVKISKQKKLQWDNNWKKNQYGNFFFTASIAIPVAIEVLYQKNNFSKQEFNLVVEYLDFLNNQMLQTAPTKNEWWSPNNLSFDYAILEKSKNINAIKLDIPWSDLGSWKEISKIFNKNKSKYFKKKNVFYRPWGSYTNLFKGKNFLVKELNVKSKGILSLQKHYHRSEHWLITQGKPLITLNKKKLSKSVNQSIYIPKGAIHRIENPFKINVKILEIQKGSILKETDIVRYQDIYGRVG